MNSPDFEYIQMGFISLIHPFSPPIVKLYPMGDSVLYLLIKLAVEALLDTAFSLKFRMIPQPMIR